MKTPDIKIPGFRGFDYENAVECCEMDKRMLIREVLKTHKDGLFFAEATLSATGSRTCRRRAARRGCRCRSCS